MVLENITVDEIVQLQEKNLCILSHVEKMKQISKQETGLSLKIEGKHSEKGKKMERGETGKEAIREST